VLLTIDIGNSNVVLGLFVQDDLVASWRLASDRERMPDEWWAQIHAISDSEAIDLRLVRGAIVSSVVPRMTAKFRELIEQRVGVTPHVVSTRLDLGIEVQTDNPEEVGADRIVNSVAARSLYSTPCIVVDFGTATTFDVVSREGNYVGGAIAPGVQLALDALTGRAARLSAVELLIPERAIGRTTIHSVQSGTVLGYLGLVEGLLARISAELGTQPSIISTGGLGDLFYRSSSMIEAYEPDLTLVGLKLLYRHLTGNA
jgi:type III pantothenate kinase